MANITVRFEYCTSQLEPLFTNARLKGSWTDDGGHSDQWSVVPMASMRCANGCLAFFAEVELKEEDAGKEFSWGVMLDAPGRKDLWGIMTEQGDWEESWLFRTFTLDASHTVQTYHVTPVRSMGSNPYYKDEHGKPGILFTVWAPYARNVELVLAADDSNGYIWDDGRGVAAAYPMNRDEQGIWSTDVNSADFAEFGAWVGKRYMYRVTREDGSIVYRTDLYSRRQAGTGGSDPIEDWSGEEADLDCTKSCSIVVDPDRIYDPEKEENGSMGAMVSSQEFWKQEFNPLRPIPVSLQDMVIYEMHVGGLGAAHEGPGTLEDAIGMLDYLDDLGVNVVELLPMSAFGGVAGWGYGSSHFYTIKYDSKGKDLFKRFVRECHRRGIAVIVDVVYNHYDQDGERAEWMYDTTRHDHNSYYFYQGSIEEYPDFPEGGYCDNMSTGYLPNMREEIVRGMMIGSAFTMAMEYHVDGFRMDLTQALHSFNVLHKDGSAVPEANECGIRFMREWARTLHFFKPHATLIAEDHSEWYDLAKSQKTGGVGFDASWWSEWYHQLVGDSSQDASKARLLRNMGYGTNYGLKMNMFSGMLMASPGRVVYHKSHDEAGNSEHSARNIQVAVNGMLFDNTRFWAEARCRAVTGLSLLSAGTPMFFMGEEVCAPQPYRHDDFVDMRDDYHALREDSGKNMFRFYCDLIRLRLDNPALRSPGIEILKTHNQQRILVFRRWFGHDEYVVVVSLHNNPFDGYDIRHRSLRGKTWVELCNSDSTLYGGAGMLNEGILDSTEATLRVRIPASSVSVFGRK